MPVTWKIKKDWQTENERCGRGMVEFPPSRQSSSYIPIRGWHSLISHIITLVRGALRSLVGTEEEGRLGTVCPERRDDGGRGKGGVVADFSSRLASGGQIYGHLGYWFTGRRHRRQEVAPVRMDRRHPGCARARNNPGRHHMFVRSRAVSRVVMAC